MIVVIGEWADRDRGKRRSLSDRSDFKGITIRQLNDRPSGRIRDTIRTRISVGNARSGRRTDRSSRLSSKRSESRDHHSDRELTARYSRDRRGRWGAIRSSQNVETRATASHIERRHIDLRDQAYRSGYIAGSSPHRRTRCLIDRGGVRETSESSIDPREIKISRQWVIFASSSRPSVEESGLLTFAFDRPVSSTIRDCFMRSSFETAVEERSLRP